MYKNIPNISQEASGCHVRLYSTGKALNLYISSSEGFVVFWNDPDPLYCRLTQPCFLTVNQLKITLLKNQRSKLHVGAPLNNSETLQSFHRFFNDDKCLKTIIQTRHQLLLLWLSVLLYVLPERSKGKLTLLIPEGELGQCRVQHCEKIKNKITT